ncbi:hypothetical protein [Spartinivicinus ruber]|uniref:hypothetical protein n=1 Tax=Spartinivicinus ruber TaxID=2683272 RepID=UPI0013D7F370|nr:hypothetical protein [Spartinivicinus ruber]
MLEVGKSTLDDLVIDFISLLDEKYIPNPMLKQEFDFFQFVIETYDLKGAGQWIADLIVESDPLEASLMQKFSASGESILEWEVGVLLSKAREKLGINYEWQEQNYGKK